MQILLGCRANLISRSFHSTCIHVLHMATCWATVSSSTYCLASLLGNNVRTALVRCIIFIYVFFLFWKFHSDMHVR